VVVVFTDASFKETLQIPQAKGGALQDVANVVMANRIILSLFAPNFEGYDRLSQIDKSEWEVVEYEGLTRRRRCSATPPTRRTSARRSSSSRRACRSRPRRSRSSAARMAKKLKVGDRLRGYTVTKVFGPGAMAISYAAAVADGRKIFLKQYKSPAPTVVWYGAFVDYQQELARACARQGGQLRVRLVDAFEERWGGPTYFQAYEFVEHGGDLQQILDEERAEHERTGRSPLLDPAVWARHVTWAKVLLAASRAARVEDRARRPQAAQRLPDPRRVARRRLPAQAHRHGLLGARRPARAVARHPGLRGERQLPLARAHHARRVPGLASDVFTCGLHAPRAARRRAPVLARRPGRVRRPGAPPRGRARRCSPA
jgi:hypothetical protein